mgnify:CR=1 FL=1
MAPVRESSAAADRVGYERLDGVAAEARDLDVEALYETVMRKGLK